MNGLQILTILLGVIGLAGGGAGYFWKSRGDTIIQLQGKEIEYWKDKAGALEKDIAALRAERDSLKVQNEGMINLSQGSPQLVKLIREVRKLANAVKLIAQNGEARGRP